MLSTNVLGNTAFSTRVRAMSRMGTLCGVFGIMLFSLGMTQVGSCLGPRVVTCTTATVLEDCNDDDPCTTDTCVVAAGATDGECDHTAACEDDHCTDAGCVACIADDECDDSVDCTTDACGDNGTCSSTADDAACDDSDACTDDSCDAATGCANTQIDCDDAVACTDDGCAAGACTHTDNCAAGSACNETTGECVLTCVVGDLCDDADPCTDDACVDGACANTPKDCDDSVACTDDSCDAVTGDCVNADNCTAPETCNLTTGLCGAVAACTDDAGCDDGVFCNGLETCDLVTDPANGVCVDGTRPCGDTIADGTVGACGDEGVTESCAEGDAAAVCTACPTVTVDFTIGLDNLTGTAGDDTFYAAWDYTTGGVKVNTLDTGDTANGLAGTDVVNATFVGTASSDIVPILTGIETINITDNTSTAFTTTLKLGSSSGITAVNSVSSTDTATVADIGTAVNLGLNNTDMGITATYKAAATSGTAEALTLTLTDVADASTSVATIATDAASGFETINVVTAGTTASVLHQLATTGNTTTLKTMNVSGTQSVTLQTIPTSLTTTISASGMTSPAAFQLGSGTSITGSSVYTTFQTIDLGYLTGGPGNDVFIFAATLTSSDADGTTEYIDGGAGTDVLQASLGASISSAPHIKNIEEFRLNATGDYTLACPTIAAGSALTTITIESDATSSGSQNTLTLSSVPYQPTSSTALPALAYRGNGAEGNQYFDAVTYTGSGVSSGSSDSLAITVGNRGTDLGTTSSSNAYNVGLITAASIETLTITVTDVPVTGSTATTFNGITALGMTSLTVTSEDDVILGTVTGKADGLATVDLSAASRIRSTTNIANLATSAVVTLTADNDTVTITGDTGMTGITVNCGAGDDVITTTSTTNTYTLNGEAGDDNLTGSDGADTINGGDGNDTIDGGAGADTLSGGSGNDTITGGAGIDNVIGGAGIDIYRFIVADGLANGTDNITDFDTITFVKADGDQIDCTNLVGGAMVYVETASGTVLAAPADNTIVVVTPGANGTAGLGFATTQDLVVALFTAVTGAIAADPPDLGTLIIVTAQDATASTGIANIWFVRDDATSTTITVALDTIQLIGQVNTGATTSATFMTFWETSMFDLTP